MRRIWVTRSQPGADRSAEVLRQSGYDPIIAPLVEISVPDKTPQTPPEDVVLIITSQNALNSLVKLSSKRHWTLICVGDATADLAKHYGFNDVKSASGTSDDVTRFIENNYAKTTHAFWHLSGNNVRGSIVEDLKTDGFNAVREVIYVSQSVTSLPRINLNAIDCVLLYSPLAAKTLRELKVKTDHMSAISLSGAVDTALKGLSFKSRHIAAAPNETALIRALDCAP